MPVEACISHCPTTIMSCYIIIADHPHLTEMIEPDTIITEGEDVVFKCTAEGVPAPTISWSYSGMMVTENNQKFYMNSTSHLVNRMSVTTSFFTILSVGALMSEEIKCIADPPLPENIGGKVLNATMSNTQLTVLGMTLSQFFTATLA